MSAYPPTGPDRTNRPDELGDLLSAGLERDLATPVDTVRLLDGARVGAVRLRRRRRAYGAATAVLLVVAVPFGMTRLTGLLGTSGVTPPAAHDTLTPEPTASPSTAAVDVPPDQYQGDLPQLVGAGQPVQAPVGIPFGAILLPKDAGKDLDRLLTTRGQPTKRTSAVYDTVVQVCEGQPGGGQWNLESVVRNYEEPLPGTTPGWELHAVVRALTVTGAKNQVRWLQRNLETCTTKLGDGHWTLQSPVQAGDTQVLATIEEGNAVLAVGAVRVGAATAGFYLRVPASAGSLSARRQLAVGDGSALLAQAAARLAAYNVSAKALAALGGLLQATALSPATSPSATP
jgi:hypothetical protein